MIHAKLIKVLVHQTPRAMIAMLIVSSVYFGVFIKFIPLSTLSIWLCFQLLLAGYRCHNAKMFEKHLQLNNQLAIYNRPLSNL